MKRFTSGLAASDGDAAHLARLPFTQLPSFVAGSLVLTDRGDVLVEDVRPGDVLLTHDAGPQRVSAVGQRRCAAVAETAPICIKAGTLGQHDTVFLAAQHRIMIRDNLAALLFGNAEVLVRAGDLVNAQSVQRIEGGQVDYVHLMLDRPQLILLHGLVIEALVPGQVLASMPEADPTARRLLRPFEAQILMTAAA